jgi:hypothetical protein
MRLPGTLAATHSMEGPMPGAARVEERKAPVGLTHALLVLGLVAAVVLTHPSRDLAAGSAKLFLPTVAKPRQAGIACGSWWRGEYSNPQSDHSLTSLRATGASWVSLLVTGFQDTFRSTAIYSNESTPSDEDLAHAIATAHRLGLKVMLKPHVDLSNDPAHWRGDIGFEREADWAAWFDSYRQFLYHYAELAQANGVEQFCVGCELSGTSVRETDWRETIAGVRARFTGPVVYASNHSGEEVSIRWWDAVDYIGVDAYYSLTEKDNPTVVELKAAWTPHLNRLASLATTWHKPILLTEIGYRSIDGTNRYPADWWTTGTLDPQEQADCYEAALQSLWHQPWFAGMFWWTWTTDPSVGGPCNTDFTPYDKPAEDLLRTWYGASPRSAPTPGAVPDYSVTLDIYSDELELGWQDWSWGVALDLAATDAVHTGAHSISATLGPWSALSFWHAPFPTDRYGYLTFWIRGSSDGELHLWALFFDEQGAELRRRRVDDCRYIEGGTIEPERWKQVVIPLVDLDAARRTVTRVAIQDRSGQPASKLWLDEIQLVGQ